MTRERGPSPSLFGVLAALILPLGALAQVTHLGSEFRVNTYTPNGQGFAAAASDADGDFVVAWGSYGQDESSTGIFAQRFSNQGTALGADFQVNSYTEDAQSNPAIGADANGGFVVAWTSYYQDHSYRGIFGRRFSAAGVPLASEFQVNLFTPGFQQDPTIAVDADGDFVVAWKSVLPDGSYQAVLARRFSSMGAALGIEIQVNEPIEGHYPRAPSVAADADGDFVVTWMSDNQDGSSLSVFARRFSSAGAALAGEFQVNTFTQAAQRYPAVASDPDGDFTVAWQSAFQDGADDGIFVRRFSSAGAALTGELQVNAFTNGNQRGPSVTAAASGDFVVAWHDMGRDGSLYGVFARRFSSAGAALTEDFQVNTYTIQTQADPWVAAEASGAFVVVWESNHQDGFFFDVFAQRFALPITLDADGDGSVSPLTDGLLVLRYLFGFRGATLVNGAIDAVGCMRCNSTSIEAYLAGVSQPPAGPAQATPLGLEFQVNSHTQSLQIDPALATDAAGNFVVAWRSFLQDGSYHGIFARRFSSAGASLGGEFLVNSYTNSTQGGASVAREANGDFVVAWQSSDGSNYGIFAKRFSSAGASLASEFQVNTYTPSMQYKPSVAADADGDFVVVWTGSGNQDGDQSGIFAQRFSSAGAPLASEFRVNTYTASSQTTPVAAAQADGDFVVVWRNYGLDGSGPGVSAQRFSSAGTPLATELQVNSFTLSTQDNPSVALAADGGFVVAWMSYYQDGAKDGVFARRFSSAGAGLATEFQVNTATLDRQRQPSVASQADGDFVVTWDSNAQDGSSRGVFSRRFSSAGTPLATELQVNTYTTAEQSLPSVAGVTNGAFVVAWMSDGQDGDAGGVFAQRFGDLISLDVDGDGSAGPLTDGILALRYLFGFRGATLVTGAVANGCTRCDATAIEAYLSALTN